MPECRDQGDGKGQPGSPCNLDEIIPGGYYPIGNINSAATNSNRNGARAAEEIAIRKANWSKALEFVGDSVVLAAKDGPVQTLNRKGYDALEVPETVVRAADEYGCRTPSKILSADELDGRESFDPTPDAVAALDWVWERICLAGMDDSKAKPEIRCFRKTMSGGVVVQGFLRDGVVFINEDLASGTSVELRQTVLEEAAHYLSGSRDCTRDMQDWAFKFAVRMAMAGEAVVAG